MAIILALGYETFASGASQRRALRYATAGARPNALANGLFTALFARKDWNLLTN